MNLCDRDTLRPLLERHGFHFSKSMGQNFLIDREIPFEIAAASRAGESCGVLEIGPGVGSLTAELAERAAKVVSVELDRTLLPVLAETMAPYSNVEIVSGDVMKLDLNSLAVDYENLLNRDVRSDYANTKWVTDISYIQTGEGTLRLSMIRDLYDNGIVTYRTAAQQTVNPVLDTIRLAVKKEKETAGRLQLHFTIMCASS